MKKLFGSLFVLLMIGAMLAPAAALAAPSFTYTVDDQGADDEPGQKDLTAQAAAQDPDTGDFYTSWKWDDLQWTGGNTGDGCSLFDTDTPTGNGLVDYALCATVKGGKDAATVQLVSFKLYSCNDTRSDRCAGPTLLVQKIADAGDFCTVTDSDTGAFSGLDTTIVCNITDIALEADPPITVTGEGTLLNTCSYPSREPNSDPSDCVLTEFPDDTTTTTTPDSSVTWSATLNDTATVSPTAAGSVAFKLYLDDGDPLTLPCSETATFSGSDSVDLLTGEANVSTSVSVAGTYNWTADFTPTDPTAFNPSASACGSETVIVTAATATP